MSASTNLERARELLRGVTVQLGEVREALVLEFGNQGTWQRDGNPCQLVHLAIVNLANAEAVLYAEQNDPHKPTPSGGMFRPILLHQRGEPFSHAEQKYILALQENPVTSDEVHDHVKAIARELSELEGEPALVDPLDKMLKVAVAALRKITVVLRPDEVESTKSALNVPVPGYTVQQWEDLTPNERKGLIALEKVPSGMDPAKWASFDATKRKLVLKIRAELGKDT